MLPDCGLALLLVALSSLALVPGGEVPQATCTATAAVPTRWSQDATLHGFAPNGSAPSPLPVLASTGTATQRLSCFTACTRLASCVALVTEQESGLCVLLARQLSMQDVIGGTLVPHPGALYFLSDRSPSVSSNSLSAPLPPPPPPSPPTTSGECPLSLGYRWAGALCLGFQQQLLSWKEARAQCRAQGGDLVMAATAEKLDVVSQFLLGLHYGQPTWLGGWPVNGKGTWLDGTPMDPDLFVSSSGAEESSPDSHPILIAQIARIDFFNALSPSVCEITL